MNWQTANTGFLFYTSTSYIYMYIMTHMHFFNSCGWCTWIKKGFGAVMTHVPCHVWGQIGKNSVVILKTLQAPLNAVVILHWFLLILVRLKILWPWRCHGPKDVMALKMPWPWRCHGPKDVMALKMSWPWRCLGLKDVMALNMSWHRGCQDPDNVMVLKMSSP